MTTPKTEAEMIDGAAEEHALSEGNNGNAIISFQAGVAWRDANSLPYEDAEMFQWILDQLKQGNVAQFCSFVINENSLYPNFKSVREAIRAAMKEQKK